MFAKEIVKWVRFLAVLQEYIFHKIEWVEVRKASDIIFLSETDFFFQPVSVILNFFVVSQPWWPIFLLIPP